MRHLPKIRLPKGNFIYNNFKDSICLHEYTVSNDVATYICPTGSLQMKCCSEHPLYLSTGFLYS